MSDRFLVTGARGCIGAWVLRVLVDEGLDPIFFDLGTSDHRLKLVLGDRADRPIAIQGDITSLDEVEHALDEHEITHVIHLAALQVPFCRDNPPLGAAVNVVGTTNVFEAVKRRRDRIGRVVYASSAAVYGSATNGALAPEDARDQPSTHYGIFKIANEGTARIYWQDDRVPSIGLRPYVVYGPGRDQGMTSYPTAAMLAAARGEEYRIPFGGKVQFDYAPDVARMLVAASRSDYEGALVANVPSPSVPMGQVVDAILRTAPEARISFDDTPLPFPAEVEAVALEQALGRQPVTPLAQGVAETIAHFKRS